MPSIRFTNRLDRHVDCSSCGPGEIWVKIKAAGPSTFRFTVPAHLNNPDTAWFVPRINDEKRIPVEGKFVVTRTDDVGKSFTVQSGVLPELAYDIVLRHALDVDATGDFIAMGTTTSSVFVSFNGRDEWSCVSAHLPQVHAVQIV